MREPTPRTSRLAMAAGVAAALVLVGAGFLAGRSSAPTTESTASLPAPAPPPSPTPEPVVPATLDRAALLGLTAQAMDAVASGVPMPPAIAEAAGRRFDLILPFGCEAPGTLESPGAMRWRYDPATTTLRITIDPQVWRGEQWVGTGGQADNGVFRGFWIERPWSSATRCSAPAAPTVDSEEGAAVQPAPTLAIARMVMNEEEKVRPYEVVRRTTADDFDPQQGLQLRITGRIRTASQGHPWMCVQPGRRAQRPRCLIAATFAEVRVENPKSGDVLGSWPIEDEVRGIDSGAN